MILVDGEKPEDELYKDLSGRIKTLNYLKKRNINKIGLLVISHLHEDHVGGLLEVVKRIEIE